jgi:hypothetical protein
MLRRITESNARSLLLLAVVAVLFASAAWGQMTRSLTGTVTDPSGAAIPEAKVTATQRAMGVAFERITNSAGAYLFEDLPLGVYTLEFSAPSFRSLRVEGIEVHQASAIRQDAVLEVAAQNSQLQVKSSTPLVDTETAEIGQLVDSQQITQLPLNGRDVFSLLQLAGGAETGVSPAARFTNLERPALAGGRAGYTVFRVDGMDINDQNLPSATVTPGVDAVQEFRAITDLAPASESSTSTVSVAIKSGSNALHGTLYEFFRNNDLDAHSFFERRITTPAFHTTPDQLRYNQFGGALGGPIRKDRAFFFGSVQISRQHTLSQTATVYPTAQMLQGNFSGVDPLSGSAMTNFAPVIDPLTQAPFPGNQVPASRFSSFASAFLPVAFLPANCMACQAEGLGFNFVGQQPGLTDSEQYIGRIDHRLSQTDTLFGTFQVEPGTTISSPSPIPASVLDTPSTAYMAAINEIHSFSPAAVNEFRIGYVRDRAVLQQAQDAKGAFDTFQNTPTSIPSLFPTIDVIGYPTFGNGAISDRNFEVEDSWDGADNVSYLRGNHEFKAGFELIRAHFYNTVNLNAFFIYTDGLPSSLGFTGNGFADFLIGVPFEGVTFQGTGKADMVERSVYGSYLQDTWKASRRLTLTAGLRYEFPQAWHDSDTTLNRLGTLDVGPTSQALGGRFLLGGSPDYYLPGTGVVQGSGSPLIRGSLVDPNWKDFQPRVGLAYRPFDDNRTALRAGFGVYYALQDANSLALEMLSPPFSYEAAILNLPPNVPAGQPLRDSQFFPAAPPNGIATEGDDPRNRDPRIYEWTASLEHQLSRGLLVAVEYLGNHGVKNPITVLVNEPALPNAQQLAALEANPSADSAMATARAPFPNVALSYQYIENEAQSWYQALNVRTQGRIGGRLTLSAVYTWSKALDMASAEQQLPGIASNLGLGKSYSDYDHPQRFVASWVYDLPLGQRRWKSIAGGWELTGIAAFEAGAPYSVNLGVDTAFVGGAAPTYPDLVGPLVHDDIRQSNGIYLTPANFVAPPFGTFGELTRNEFHGPGVNNFDLGLLKNVRLRERLAVQLRGEFFNAFNHAQFAFAGSALATSISAPAAGETLPQIAYTAPSEFGRATARAPRVVQFGMKLVW